jgi:hypothetical protein
MPPIVGSKLYCGFFAPKTHNRPSLMQIFLHNLRRGSASRNLVIRGRAGAFIGLPPAL